MMNDCRYDLSPVNNSDWSMNSPNAQYQAKINLHIIHVNVSQFVCQKYFCSGKYQL